MASSGGIPCSRACLARVAASSAVPSRMLRRMAAKVSACMPAPQGRLERAMAALSVMQVTPASQGQPGSQHVLKSLSPFSKMLADVQNLIEVQQADKEILRL